MREVVSVDLVDGPDGSRRVVEVLAATWGQSMRYPGELVQVVAEYGGYAAVAVRGGTDVGASFGFLAADGHLHSHVTGVVPGLAGQGVGAELKQHQRQWAAARGIDRITWTFDPLVRRNAVFNLVKLGAVVIDYRVDYYGALADTINAGEETDRLVVSWATAGALPAGTVEPDAADIVVPTPADVERLRVLDPGAARAQRHEMRAAMLEALDADLVVRGLDVHGSYVLGRRMAP